MDVFMSVRRYRLTYFDAISTPYMNSRRSGRPSFKSQSHQSPIQQFHIMEKICVQGDWFENKKFPNVIFNECTYQVRYNFENSSLNIAAWRIIFCRTNPMVILQIIKNNTRRRQGTKTLRQLIQTNYQFRCCYFLGIDFLKKTGLLKWQQSQVLKFLAQNKQKFNFTNIPTALQLNNYKIIPEFMLFEMYNPLELLFDALGAGEVIKSLTNGRHSQIFNIISRLCDYLPQQFNQFDQNDLHLIRNAQQNTKNKLLGMFRFELTAYTYKYNPEIYTQRKFKDASFGQKFFIFNLTTTTSLIFNQVEKFKSKKKGFRNKNLYIHGQSGIGKSISLSLLVELHNIIEIFRINISEQYYKTLISYYPSLGQINSYPKYFYYSLTAKSNSINFYNVIRMQLPYDLYTKNLRNKQLMPEIKAYYKRNNIQIIFIIDQINIYFSILRKCEEMFQQHLKVQEKGIQDILQTIQNQRIIFASSENAQSSLFQSFNSNKLLYKSRIQAIRIDYESHSISKKQDQERLKEILNIIYFQTVNQLRKLQRHHQIEEKMSQFQQLQGFIKNHGLDELRFLSQLTHERIKSFFKYNPLMLNHSLRQYQNLFLQIHDHTVKQLSQLYKNFIKKGNQQEKYRKFTQTMRIRIQALQQSTSQNMAQRFQYNLGYDVNADSNELFKEHAEVHGKRLIVYLSPSTFVKITAFMDEQEDLIGKIVDQVVKETADNRNLIGSMFDNISVKIFSQSSIFLSLFKCYLILNKDAPTPHYFQAFSRILSSQQILKNTKNKAQKAQNSLDTQITDRTSIYIRFSELFKTLFVGKISPRFWLCAAPHTKISSKLRQDLNYSGNSQCIDFLLIQNHQKNKFEVYMDIQGMETQKMKDFYNLDTFDFSFSMEIDKIIDKIDRARLFFLKFDQVALKENQQGGKQIVNRLIIKRLSDKTRKNLPIQHMSRNYEFNRSHSLIIPKVMVNQAKKHIKQTDRINLIAIEDIQVGTIDQSFGYKSQIQPIRRSIIKKIKQRIDIWSKKHASYKK